MQIRPHPALKATMKDIAGLYFSSMDVGLAARDYLRFKRHYAVDFDGVTLGFWQHVAARADKLYAKFHSDKFQKRLQQEHASVD